MLDYLKRKVKQLGGAYSDDTHSQNMDDDYQHMNDAGGYNQHNPVSQVHHNAIFYRTAL